MTPPPIDRFGEYFHIECLKFYYSYLECYHLEELPHENYLNFDFPEGTYTIKIQDLIDKAFEEKERLEANYNDKFNYNQDDEFNELS